MRDGDIDVGGHPRQQRLVRVLHLDDDVVGDDVLRCRRVQAQLLDAALELAVRKGIDVEADRLPDL